MPFKDECGICGRVLSTRLLSQCQRCKRLFCRDCMVPDVSTGDPRVMLCLNCARRLVAPRPVPKYSGLTSYLKFRGAFTDTVKLSFAGLDGIIGSNLPISAYRNESWWRNSPRGAQAKAWLAAGWEVQEVNLKEGYAVFKKRPGATSKNLKRKSKETRIKKPFTPAPVHIPKPKQPSKTKLSKLYARIKNLERKKSPIPNYRGSFKPKPKHEKTLFSSSKKPQ